MAFPDDAPDLGELFHTAFRGLRRTWSQQLAPWELTPHQWRALLTVVQRRSHPHRGSGPGSGTDRARNTQARDDVRLKDLAERLHIAPRSATEVVDHLEAKGLVRRDPSPGDRRATLIVATEAGEALFTAIQAERRDKSSEYFARINDHDRSELARILEQLGQ